MTGVHDVIEEFISIIESNVTDPNSTRLSKNLKWVYDDIPLASLSAPNYPRISVVSFGAPSVPHNLCSNEQRVTARIEVQIRVKRKKWKTQTGLQFADDLTFDVLAALASEAGRSDLLNNANVFHSVLEAENTIYEDDLIVKQLIYKNVFKRSFDMFETLFDSDNEQLFDSDNEELMVRI